MLKKKKLLSLFLIFIFGLILLPYDAFASKYGICLTNVKYQQDSNTGKMTKSEWGIQKVQINNAYTSLTNPCYDCQFRVKPYKVGVGTLGGVVASMRGGKVAINSSDGSAETGTYYLKVARYDYTLLSSTVDLVWYFQ